MPSEMQTFYTYEVSGTDKSMGPISYLVVARSSEEASRKVRDVTWLTTTHPNVSRKTWLEAEDILGNDDELLTRLRSYEPVLVPLG